MENFARKVSSNIMTKEWPLFQNSFFTTGKYLVSSTFPGKMPQENLSKKIFWMNVLISATPFLLVLPGKEHSFQKKIRTFHDRTTTGLSFCHWWIAHKIKKNKNWNIFCCWFFSRNTCFRNSSHRKNLKHNTRTFSHQDTFSITQEQKNFKLLHYSAQRLTFCNQTYAWPGWKIRWTWDLQRNWRS